MTRASATAGDAATREPGEVLVITAEDVLRVRATGGDTYEGQPAAYPWGWVFGGHLLAQSLLAAGATVEPGFTPHALHASFVQKARTGQPLSYQVQRLRDGRSYCTRHVVGSQSGSTLLTVQVSFAAAPSLARPSTSAVLPEPPTGDLTAAWTTAFERFEVPTEALGRVRWWYRFADAVAGGPLAHAAGLAFLSDDMPAEAVADAHRSPPLERLATSEWVGASLDHAIWFHAPVRADAWHLYDVTCINYAGGRGLAIGRVFDQDGTHVATLSQETHLVRE
jgi:acyl-CoA thioesterase-2